MPILKRSKSFLLKNVERPMIKYFLFSIFDACVGATGMLLYGLFTVTYGPIWIRNQFIGLWLLTIIFFTSIQSLCIEVKSWKNYTHLAIDFVYFVIQFTLNLLMFIFYVIASKIDASIWSFYLLAVNLTNLFIIFSRRANLNVNTSLPENQQAAEIKLINQDNKLNTESKCSLFYKKFHFILGIVNEVLKVVFLIFSCFILIGAATEATHKINYPARGKIINVNINNIDQKTIRVHYLCSNTFFDNNSLPIFMIDGDATHGLVDYLSLQKLLNSHNRTSCIWDKPGSGYSDYLYNTIKSYDSPFYHNMIKSIVINEELQNMKLAFVGWGSGGGDLLYRYAYDHPEMVDSLTFLDVEPNNIEFFIKNKLNNFSQLEASNYKNEKYALRQQRADLINGIGVPWGIMSQFEESAKTFFSKFNDEITSFMHIEKKWATQRYFLQLMKNKNSSFTNGLILDKKIPLNVLITSKSDEQIVEQICKPQKFETNSSECIYEINSNKILIQEKLKLVNLAVETKLVKCSHDECNTNYFVENGANYTVFNLLNVFNL